MSSDPAPAPSAAPANLPPPAVSSADTARRPPTAAGTLLFRPFSGRSSAAGEAIAEPPRAREDDAGAPDHADSATEEPGNRGEAGAEPRSSVHEVRGADQEAPRQEDVPTMDPVPFPTWDAGGGAGGDDAWLTLLDLETSHAEGAIATEAGGGADGAVKSPEEGESGAAEVAAVLERLACRVRDGDDLTHGLVDGRGSSLESLLAGVVAGYLRGRGAADR